MIALAVFAALGVALYALHRLSVWMEARGWVKFKDRRGSSGALGSAFLELQSMIEPSKRHVVEERRKEDVDESDAGDPPDPGAPRPPVTP